MQYFVIACVALAAQLAAQTQVARFDFENQLGSPQPPFAYVSNVGLTKPHQFGGSTPDKSLALPLVWSTGGTLSFTLWPLYGYRIDYSHLQWQVANPPGVPDDVSAVTVFANGLQIASLGPIPHNTLIDIDLSTVAELQDCKDTVIFQFVFTGNPAGQVPHEISFISVAGEPCDLQLNSVTPASLPTVTSDYFQIIGQGFLDALGNSRVTQVKFGNAALAPYVVGGFGPGSYEVFSQWKIRVRPPQCVTPGNYLIEVTTDCGAMSVPVTLVGPVAATLAAEASHPAGQVQCYSMHGGGPGPQVLILGVSSLKQPSAIPGLLNLDIGANFTVFATSVQIGDCVQFCLNVPVGKINLCYFFQGIVWHVNNFDLTSQMPTTNVLQTCWF